MTKNADFAITYLNGKYTDDIIAMNNLRVMDFINKVATNIHKSFPVRLGKIFPQFENLVNTFRTVTCKAITQVPITPVIVRESTIPEPTTLELVETPATSEPTTLEPTTLEPTTLEPTTLEPTTLEPTTLELVETPAIPEPTTFELVETPAIPEPTTFELVETPATSKHECECVQFLPEESKSSEVPKESQYYEVPEESKSSEVPKESQYYEVPKESQYYGVPKESQYYGVPEVEISAPVFDLPTITIVMVYYKHRELLVATLNTLKDSQCKTFDVVIVIDGSSFKQEIFDIPGLYSFKIQVIHIHSSRKTWVNPCVAFNMGIKVATGDVILLQSPECKHIGDCLLYVQNNIWPDKYITLACQAESNIWYNHASENPQGLHFASAIYKDKLLSIGGFDEDYSQGYGFDDDDLLWRIKNKLGLDVIILDDTVPYVYHQKHKPAPFINCKSTSKAYKLWERNKNIFEAKTR